MDANEFSASGGRYANEVVSPFLMAHPHLHPFDDKPI
jgi:hypothetical protein